MKRLASFFIVQPTHYKTYLYIISHAMTTQQVLINDIRPQTEFKTLTFTGHKKTDVIKKGFGQAMLREKIEPACHWSAELVCSGHLSELWDAILVFMSKYIHLGNINLPTYILGQYRKFRYIWYRHNFQTELEARNNEDIRQLFAEIVITLTLSPKKNPFEYIKIDREEEFKLSTIRERLRATTTAFIEPIFKPDDPLEIMQVVNEFYFSLVDRRSGDAIFWLNWIIEFDQYCRKRKEPCYLEKRRFEGLVGVQEPSVKWQSDLIWIIWECLENYAAVIGMPFIQETVHSLYELFCICYTNAITNKRRFMMYYAISLLTEPLTQENMPVLKHADKIPIWVASISEVIYTQIKMNEVTWRPADDTNTLNIMKGQSNINHQQSIYKLNLLAELEGL